jgi:hypothetical protein
MLARQPPLSSGVMRHTPNIVVNTVPLGEIRMGCEAWGLSIRVNDFEFTAIKSEPVLVNTGDWSRRVQESRCGQYLIVEAQFFTFVLNIEEKTVSLFRATIRGPNSIWCEETPIYKSDSCHVDRVDGRHCYLQFPFVPDSAFWDTFRIYEKLRLAQIQHAHDA